MLQIRLQGDQAEARAFLDALAAGGAEVAVGTTKDRGEYAHVYATVRMPGYTTAAAPADGPVRTTATLGRPGREPPRRRRPQAALMGLHTYAGWRDVPPHLFTRSQLRELEFPREPVAAAKVAIVHTRDWSDHEAAVELYDAYRCPPTSSSAGSLAAAAARATRPRVCADCGACGLLRPLVGADGRALCSACFSVVLLRRAQAERAEARAAAARTVAQLLTRTGAAVLQVDARNPGPTPAGSARRDVAARIRAVDLDGRRLLDVLVDLTGARSKFRDPAALAREKAEPKVHKVLLGRPLIAWRWDEFAELRTAAPHPDWARPSRFDVRHEALVDVAELSRQWRGQLDERRNLLPTLHPGAPDRLLLHLQRIAATHTPSPDERDEQRTEGPVTAAAVR